MVKTFNEAAYSVRNHLKQIHHLKQNHVRIFKETTGWNYKTIDWFSLTVKSTKSKNFQPFSKHLRTKQLVDSTNQQVVFHLVWKTFNFKKVLIHINFRFNKRVDHTLIYLDLTHTQQQHQSFIKHLGFGFFKSLDHSWSKSPPIWWRQIPGCLC